MEKEEKATVVIFISLLALLFVGLATCSILFYISCYTLRDNVAGLRMFSEEVLPSVACRTLGPLLVSLALFVCNKKKDCEAISTYTHTVHTREPRKKTTLAFSSLFIFILYGLNSESVAYYQMV